MNEIKIYTFSSCPYCINAKKLLEKLNLNYEEVVVTRDEVKVLSSKTNCNTVPQIFINNTFIGGYTDLYNLVTKDELNNFLN